jgi:hypothetical protein
MKYIFLLFIFLNSTASTKAQEVKSVAEKISIKMRDSLSLTNSQKNQISLINFDLQSQKLAVRNQYRGLDTIQKKIQQIENKRDSLYRTVLTEEKYQLYLQKKHTLVSSN